MKNNPLISIIIPTFNREKILARSINSVLKQTYKNFELIIVDDRSTDNTKKLVEDYINKDKRIRYIKNTHKQGPGGARNQGIELAKGKYIAFLDSDDKWKKFHLKDLISYSEKYELKAISSLVLKERNGKLEKINKIDKCINNLKPKNIKRLYFFKEDLFEYLILNPTQIFNMDCLLIRRDIIKEIGFFREDFLNSEDNDFVSRIILKGYFTFLNKYTAIWSEGIDNLVAIKGTEDITKLTHLSSCFKSRKKHISITKNRIKESKIIINKKRLYKRIKEKRGDLYFEIGYTFRKVNKIYSLYNYMISLFYSYRPLTLKAIRKLFIWGYYKKGPI